MLGIVEKFKLSKWETPWQTATLWILNIIMKIDFDLFSKVRNCETHLDAEAFPSEWIRAYIAYEKYVFQGKEANLTDLGDLLHASYIPYCGLVIIENQLCDILNKIKRKTRYKKLEDIDFRNIKYIRGLNPNPR